MDCDDARLYGKTQRRASNYDMMRDQMQGQFLNYDIDPMVQKYGLNCDDMHVFIRFVQRDYRICRATGRVERLSDDGAWTQANFNESMTIFDVLCYAKPQAELAHEFCALNQLKGIVHTSAPGNEFFATYVKQFAGSAEALRVACIKLGGVPHPVGEVAFQLQLFDFMPVLFQFWDADEEFDAQMRIKWDKNVLDFMHFETTFYAAMCLYERLIELMQAPLQ